MKLRELSRENVKSTAKVRSTTRLSQVELRSVAAAGPTKVDPEICAIHDYYIQDALA